MKIGFLFKDGTRTEYDDPRMTEEALRELGQDLTEGRTMVLAAWEDVEGIYARRRYVRAEDVKELIVSEHIDEIPKEEKEEEKGGQDVA